MAIHKPSQGFPSAPAPVGYESVIPNPKLKLLDQMREVMRLKHYSIRTERTYCDWVKRFVNFHGMKSREEMLPAEPKMEGFLSQLAVKANVAVSTQSQAFNALLFVYWEVLHLQVGKIESVRACIHRRYLCPKYHRQSFHEYAKESILWCRGAAACYLEQRSRGKPHHTAVRALAYKWQRVIFRCWQDRKPYHDQLYEKALRDAGSHLVALFSKVELGKSPFKNSAANN
jgi:Phage integrase, N-terminal SAM-like domain